MKLKQKILAGLIVLALLGGALTACNSGKEESSSSASSSEASSSQASSSEESQEQDTDEEEGVWSWSMEVPEGFANTEEDPNTYTSADGTCTINATVILKVDDIAGLTVEGYKEILQTSFGESAQIEVPTVVVDETPEGFPRAKTYAIITMEDRAVHQMQYLMNGEELEYVITFTWIDGDWEALMKKTIETVEVKDGTLPSSVEPMNIDFQEPEGFAPQEGNPSMLYAPGYPEDSSNIMVSIMPKEPTFLDATQEEFQEMVESSYAQFGIQTQVDVQEFTFTELCGMPAIRFHIVYDLQGTRMEQIEYFVDGDYTYVFSFTQAGDAQWMEEFEKTIQTITMERG